MKSSVEHFFRGFLPLMIALLAKETASQGSYLGCFKDDHRARAFATSAGTYDPSNLTPTICMAQCQRWSYRFSAMTEGRFCFCASQPPTVAPSADSYCDETCSGPSSTDKCGGLDFISVYEVNVLMSGMELSVYGLTTPLVEVQTRIYFNLTRIDGPSNVYYAVDYGDGTGYSPYNDTTMLYRSYAAPGEYLITAQANDSLKTKSSVSVSVQAPVNYLQFYCPPEVAALEEFRCNATVLAGTYLNLTITYGDGVTETFAIADPYYFTAGPGIPHWAVTSVTVDTPTSTYIMPNSEFQNDGIVLAFEYYGTGAGTITFMIMAPCPSGGYCYNSNNCGGTCAAGESTCSGTDIYCPKNQACGSAAASSCTSGNTRYSGSSGMVYSIVQPIAPVTSGIGKQVYQLDPTTNPVYVKKGYVIGFSSTVPIATRAVWSNEVSDLLASGPCAGSCSGTVIGSRHLVRAIAAKPTNILFFHTYTIPDIYLVLVNVKNDLLPNAPHALANQTVLVAIGINISTIVAPEFVATNDLVHIYLEPHTGSNVTYLWTLGDGTELNTTTPWLNYTYTRRGCFWANNTAYNAISRKSSNQTLICVEDRLTNLTVRNNISDASQITLFWFTMLWGSDYLCDWSYGDGTTAKTDPTSTPISGVVWSHRYVNDGSYSVNVTCYNNISTEVELFTQYVEWPIINLRLLKNGTLAGAPFQITYLIDNGTVPSFNFTFDGTPRLTTYTGSTKTGITDQIGPYSISIHEVIINAWNHISFVTLVVNFTIESKIVNPKSTCDLAETVSDQLVTFTASVSDGSNVNITWNYVDGSALDNFLQTPGVTAAPGLTQIKQHAFPRGGLFIIQVTICNQLDTYVFNHSLIVYGKIENVTLLNTGPVPFIRGHGPVNFTFSSPTPPFNVAVMFVYADGQKSGSLLFDINAIYSYDYIAEGTYQVMANISNRMTWGPVATTVIVSQPVINMYLYFDVPHASLNVPFKAGVGMDVGPNVILFFEFGDGSPVQSFPRTATTGYQLDNATHTYTALGTYTITVIAMNAIGNTTQKYIVVVQNAVLPLFSLTSTAPVLFPTGVVQFTLTYPSGAVLPTSASMQFFFGDNSSSALMPLPFTTSPYSFTIPHTYPIDGNFIAQCVVSNLASNQTFPVPVGVYVPITGLTAKPMYQPDIPFGGPLQPGFGVLSDTFPRDKDIVFTTSVQGTVSYYQVTLLDKNGNVLMTVNETSSPFSMSYLKSITANGQYKVLITAINPFSSQTYSINLNVNRTVSGGSLDVNPTSGPTSTTWNFVSSFQDLGIDSCVVIDFGDGTKGVYGNNSAYCAQVTSSPVLGPLTNPMTVSKKYSASKTYVATMSAYDPLANYSTSVNIVVSTLDCSLPNIAIKDSTPLFFAPRLCNRADAFEVVGITNLDCPISVTNSKSWTVDLVDEGTGQPLTRLSNVTSLPTAWNAEISVPARFLAYGLYLFTYKVQINATPFLSEVSTFIRIRRTPIVAVLATNGMSMITRGYGGYITIEPGKYSYDPDLGPGQKQVFDNFVWYCRQVDEQFSYDPSGNIMPGASSVVYTEAQLATMGNATRGGCFRQGPGMINFNGSSLNFTSKNMRSNDTYVFQVTVFKDKRSSTAQLIVDLVEGNPPSVEIGCIDKNLCTPLTRRVRINPTNRVSLYANCIADCLSPITYYWTIYRLGLNNAWLPLADMEVYVSGVNETNSREIAITNQLFIDGFALYKNLVDYRVGVQVVNPNGGNTVTGSSYMEFFLNTPPYGGSCQVTPSVGTASITPFYFSCRNWFDPDGIHFYQFYATWTADGEGEEMQLGYSDSGVLNALALPQGSPSSHYNLFLHARIFDIYGAVVEYNISMITVTPLSQTDAQNFLNQLLNNKTSANQLNLIAANGDIVQMSSRFLAIADALNAATGFANQQYGNGSLTYPFPGAEDNEAYQAQRDQEAGLRGTMIQALSNATLSDFASIQLVSSTLSKITDVTSEVNRVDQEKSTAIVANLYSQMSLISSSTPIEEFLLASETLTDTIGNLLQSINDAADDGTLADLKQCKSTSFYFYDTDWETSRKGFLGLSEDDMESQFVRETNNLAQKSSASTTVSSLTNTLDKLGYLLLSKLVPGEGPINVSTPRLSLFLQKDEPSKIAGPRTVEVGGSSVALPGWCNMAPPNIDCTDTTPISIKISATPKNVFTYFADGSKVSPGSEIISIDTTDENGNPLSISNTKEPIEITIPRRNKVDPQPTQEASYMSKKDDSSLFYYKFNVTDVASSLHAAVRPNHFGVQFLIVGRFGSFPKLNGSKRGWDFIQNIPQRMSDLNDSYYSKGIDPYVVFVDNKAIKDRVGLWYIGLRQLDPSEYDLYNDTNTPAPPQPQTGRFTTNYTLLIYTSGCYYSQQNGTGWSSDGCTVSPKTTVDQTVCLCNHLTSFGGGFAVRPNVIDFDFIFSNADFLKNPTIYVTEMIIAVVYILLLIWARRQDKKDLIKLGVTPLPDNDPRDRYMYEVTVSTGLRQNAGTESKVHIILSGDFDETDARTLEDDERKVLARGSVDIFLMTVPRPLGPLNYARIWHDNSGKGKYASWYLNWMLVRDVQTGQKFHFIANQWFAVEEDDGQISRLVPVSGREQIVETGHLFSRKTSKGISDDHIWFSVIARPVTSRFTRIQRLSCCLCLLFTAMLANAMFYGVVGTSSGSGFSIGPFTITPEQIYVGIISNLIVFPVNFIIAFLFKKSRPRRLRPSRIGEALKKMQRRQALEDPHEFTRRREAALETAQGQLSTRPEGHDLERKFDSGDLYDDRPQTSRSVDLVEVSSQSAQLVETKKKKKFSLPWGFVVLGWILLWITVGVCVAFVTFYGIQFQDEKCRKWITSMLISFVTSVFLTQPIKVILLALLFSILFKKPENDDEDEEDEESLELENDEIWLHQNGRAGPYRKRYIQYEPPDPLMLERARERRLKELKLYAILREIALYLFFLWIVIVISYDFRDPRAQFIKANLEKTFVDGSRGVNAKPNTSINLMASMDDFWGWMENTFIPSQRADNWYNGQRPIGLRGYLNDVVSRIMGFATMRQLRIKRGKCKVPYLMRGAIHECNVRYSSKYEETDDFNIGWVPRQPGDNSTVLSEYHYKEASELDSYPFLTKHNLYNGGGYVAELRGDRYDLFNKLAALKKGGWIDRYTRAVFLEFSIYNVQANMFACVTMVAELLESSGFDCFYYIEPMNLLGDMTSAKMFVRVCQIIYVLFIIFFIVKEIRNIWKQRLAYFREFWNWVELWIIALSIGSVIVFAYRYIMTNRLLKIFSQSGGNAYMKFQGVAYWNELILYMIGLLVFWATLKFIKLLRFNKIMGLLGSTLKYASKTLVSFSLMFAIMFFAFVQCFYLIYNASLETFSNVIFTAEECLQMMVGKFNFGEIVEASPILGTFMFFIYMIVVFFILLTMFVTIINEAFAAVRDDIHKQSNEHEMVDFLIGRFRQWTGIDSLFGLKSNRSKLNNTKDLAHDPKVIEAQINNLPERLDRFLNCISQVYFQQDNFEGIITNQNGSGKKFMKDMNLQAELYGKSGNGKQPQRPDLDPNLFGASYGGHQLPNVDLP